MAATKSPNVPQPSQQESNPTIGGGASQAPQVLPQTGNKQTNTSLSVSGQTPVVNR